MYRILWINLFLIMLNSSCKPKVNIEPNLDKLEMVNVEGGTLTIGCTPEQECLTPIPESITVNSFKICKYEVTNKQYVVFLNKNGNQTSYFGSTWSNLTHIIKSGETFSVEEGYEEYPVLVNWGVAEAYSKWSGGRLPTKGEWEYAARGGKNSQSYKYSGSNILEEVSWNANNSNGTSHIVGQKKTNELGLYDMSGNVFEWCNDYPSSADYISHYLKGGYWDVGEHLSRVSFIGSEVNPSVMVTYHGFRFIIP